jgi:hypothetical protein
MVVIFLPIYKFFLQGQDTNTVNINYKKLINPKNEYFFSLEKCTFFYHISPKIIFDNRRKIVAGSGNGILRLLYFFKQHYITA